MSNNKANRWVLVTGGLLLSGVSLAGVHEFKAPNDGASSLTNVDATTLTPTDTLALSQRMQSQMSATEVRVTALQRRAETKKDMVMVNCTSDKLVQLRGYTAVGAQAGQAIGVAIVNHDDGARAHNFVRQSIVYQKVLVLGTEAEGCAGEDVSYIGSTIVDVDVDPSITPTDPTIPPAAVIPSPGRPPEATPFS